MIKIDHLSKKYNDNVVLDDISLEINRAMLWESSVLPEPENQRFCAASTALRHRRRER